MDSTDEVIIERRGSAGIIRLNRPKALNSLTLPMVRTITSALEEFAIDPAIAAVIVKGEGERGFCAGGDIRLLHQSGKEGSDGAKTFWREEFRLNHAISRYPKPYVVLMDGITMGGGVGLSAHGSHRIVTERTRLAMPETGIGYFPDVGATWLLPRAPGEAGTWLGLTGLAVDAPDALHAGFADHCVASSALPVLIDAIAALPASASAADVHALIKTMATDAGESAIVAASCMRISDPAGGAVIRVARRPFNCVSRPSSAASSTGLVTKALAPFSFARARSCGVSCPVHMTTGIADVCGLPVMMPVTS